MATAVAGRTADWFLTPRIGPARPAAGSDVDSSGLERLERLERRGTDSGR